MITLQMDRAGFESRPDLVTKYGQCVLDQPESELVTLRLLSPHWIHRIEDDARPLKLQNVRNDHVLMYRLALAAGIQLRGVARQIPYRVPYQIAVTYWFHGQADFFYDGELWRGVAKSEGMNDRYPHCPSNTQHIQSGETYFGYIDFERVIE